VGSQVKADGNTSRSMSKGLVRRGGLKRDVIFHRDFSHAKHFVVQECVVYFREAFVPSAVDV